MDVVVEPAWFGCIPYLVRLTADPDYDGSLRTFTPLFLVDTTFVCGLLVFFYLKPTPAEAGGERNSFLNVLAPQGYIYLELLKA